MTKETEREPSIFSLAVSIPRGVLHKMRSVAWSYLFTWKAKLNWKLERRGRPHSLPASLIVSLTPYPSRFPTLPLTLKCLLSQTVIPDKVILWIAHEDKDALTTEILDLKKHGLEVKFCDDLKSFKKIIPTLKLEPDAFIVTADDDLYYCPTWLEELVSAYNGNMQEVLCHRVHLIRTNNEGLPRPYLEWEYPTKGVESSPLNFPTAGGGALYPPGIFHFDVLKKEIFRKLCPLADDIWLFWMMRLNGTQARKIRSMRQLISGPNTQAEALWRTNVTAAEGGNDGQIQAMVENYGFPRKI